MTAFTSDPQPKDLTILGRRVHVWVGGTGPALLLFHSAWGDAEMSWSAVWKDLSRSFTIIAPDMPGFAQSDPLPIPTLAESARVMKSLVEGLRVDRVLVIGNSFGVAHAIEFASTFPDCTRHLVIVNGGYLPYVPTFLKKLISVPVIEKPFRSLMRNMVYSNKAFARAFPNPAALPPGFIERIRGYEDKHSRIVFDTAMNQPRPQSVPKVPTTVIWGTGDRLVSLNQRELIRKWLNNPSFIPIEGAGHMPQVERAEEFVAAVKSVGKG